MKKTSLIALLIGMGLFIGLGTTSAFASQDKVKQEIETRIYEVWGMDCPGCHGGVEKLVKKIAGVKSAHADWQLKQLIVTMDKNSSIDNEAIFDAIRRSNFTPGKQLKTESSSQ